MTKKILWLLSLFALLTISCQREHSNIFDPKNNIDSLDLNIRVIRADSIISLRWWPPADVDYQGFNLFRRQEPNPDFEKIAFVNAESLSFQDTTTSSQNLHIYFLTVQGDGLESVPTRKISTIPGPSQFWVLDRWNFYILNLTFDLQHIIKTHYAVWSPKDMCFNDNRSIGLVTYPEYNYYELFDPNSNYFLGGFDDLRDPYNCIYDSDNDRFLLSDSSSGVYALVSESLDLQPVNKKISRPTQLLLDAQNNIYVLDLTSAQIIKLTTEGAITSSLVGLYDGIRQFDIDIARNILYAVYKKEDGSVLVRYPLDDPEPEILYETHGSALVRSSKFDDKILLAVNLESSAEILQLSTDGERLNTLTGFKYIKDIGISAKTGNIIIADAGDATVYHLHSTGELIGKSEQAYYPNKVIINE